MNASLITLHADLSNGWRIALTRDGKAVNLEEALEQGFFVSREDANLVLSLLAKELITRDLTQK
jgi:hypothetical protein